MLNSLTAAERGYRAALASDTVSANRVRAAIGLASLEWRVRHDTAAAQEALGLLLAAPGGTFRADLERTRMYTGFARFTDARRTGQLALKAATSRADSSVAVTALANAIAEQLIASRLAGRSTADDSAAVRLAPSLVVELHRIVRGAPGALAPARQLIALSAILADGPALLTGWHSFYLAATGDTVTGILVPARKTLEELLPSTTTTWRSPDRIMRALVSSRLFDEAALVALQPGQPGCDVAATCAERREVVAYAGFLRRVRDVTDEYYRHVSLGDGNAEAWREAIGALGAAFWPSLSAHPSLPPFSLETLGTTLDSLYGAMINLGMTAGTLDMHMGHRVVDERRTVEQFGKKADVRFVVLDGMVSNGYQSWAWDGRAAHGGWGNQSLIVQVRQGYAQGAITEWTRISDSVVVRRRALALAADSAGDVTRARANAVASFPGLAARMERDGAQQLLASLRKKGLSSTELEAAFKQAYGRALDESSIFAHEGRHAIDDAIGAPGGAEEKEFRAKLSEVEFATWPRLALGGIMDPVGGDSPHGIANARVAAGLITWMGEHKREISGFDAAAPVLLQLPRLTDGQLRAAFRAMDPLATATHSGRTGGRA